MSKTIKISVSDFYKPELMKYLPEDLFDLLDEAYFYKKPFVKVPFELFQEYLRLNPNEKAYTIHPN